MSLVDNFIFNNFNNRRFEYIMIKKQMLYKNRILLYNLILKCL